MKKLLILLALGALFLSPLVFSGSPVRATIPHLVNYQGMLTESDGTTPVPNGAYSIRFSIWDDAAVGTEEWHETQAVQVTNGLFNVNLGSVTPLLLQFEEYYWLEIKVDSDDPFPRIKMTSVGYAYWARNADTAVVAVTATSGGGWVDDGAVLRLETDTDEVGVGTTSPDHKLDVRGSVGIGSPTQTGALALYLNGSADPVIRAQNYSNEGGMIRLYDEAGNITHQLESDGIGEGGYFSVYRSTSSSGFMVDGNATSNEPRVEISGSSRSANFYMDQSGNSSVQLPVDAISASESFDEPGVASDKFVGISLTLDGSVQTLLSRTITCPASGYVLVIGTAQAKVTHTNGTYNQADFGVSASPSVFPANQDVMLYFDSDASTGQYHFPVTVHGLFEVSSGSNTFYLLAQEHNGVFVVFDMQLTLVYFPTAYGTVTSTKIAGEPNIPDDQAPEAPAMTAQDVAAEKAQAEAFNAARIERELAEMRAQLEALKLELDEQNR